MSAEPLVLSFVDACTRIEAEAAALLARGPRPADAQEELPLLAARGRVLAWPVMADRPQPPFARSTRDGFAGRAAEFGAGAVQVAGLLRAGEQWTAPLGPGCSVEIMTGAPVPDGADCVLMVEHGERCGDAVRMLAGRSLAAGENVVPEGAEATQGAVVLAEGTRIGARAIAVAAACGAAHVAVRRVPRVAILATGDELVEVEAQPAPYQIRNSNSWALAAQVLAAGGEPVLHAPVADDAETLQAAVREAAAQADLLLLSGGVSMGRYDLVEPALLRCGAEFVFTGVRMQPGRPVVFGRLGGVPVFGLPGNPVSVRVCFSVFGAPVLAALCGQQAFSLPWAQAVLRGAVPEKRGLTRLLPARLSRHPEGTSVSPLPWQGSGDLAGTAAADCFLLAPEGAGTLHDGDLVTVLIAD